MQQETIAGSPVAGSSAAGSSAASSPAASSPAAGSPAASSPVAGSSAAGSSAAGSSAAGSSAAGSSAASSSAAGSPAAGFADLNEELRLDDIPVTGELPPWLSGSLIRVTPAKFDLAGDHHIRHWFDGLAMLHRFGFAGNKVSYANRFLRTEAYDRAERGEGIGTGFATDPCRAIFKRVQSIFSPDLTDNANVNLVQLGERYIAMTETPIPVEFDADTLATNGRATHAPGQISTAHPHYDAERREAVNYAVHIGARTRYRIFTTDAQDHSRTVAEVPVKEPAYMHSFGMTERYAILAEFPLVLNPLRLATGARSFIESYRWRPERGTRFQVIDRHTGGVKMTATADPFFCFHHVNAYEDGDGVVVDLIAFDDASVIDNLYIDKLREGIAATPSQLRRYRIEPGDPCAEGEVLLDRSIELPRIDYARVSTKPHTVVYAAGVRPGEPDWFNEIVKFDVADRETKTWHEDGCYVGEPVFVGRPGRDAEDDGVLLSVVFDSSTGSSFLLVLDAETLDERARAQAPHHIPFGFHGQFMR